MSVRDDDEWEDQQVDVDPPLLGKTKVLLTAHALQQMDIRGITARQVLQVIRNPHEFHDADMGRVRARRIRSGGTGAIDVVYELDLEQVIVVTAISRSWKKKR